MRLSERMARYDARARRPVEYAPEVALLEEELARVRALADKFAHIGFAGDCDEQELRAQLQAHQAAVAEVRALQPGTRVLAILDRLRGPL